MAYKRYVHRQGKRHGPYYYKNIRDESGKVKSVYLGKVNERGKKPLKITILFLFVLLITISALFLLQNRAIVLSKISAEESIAPFEIDQILIKVLVKSGEFIEKELRVMNTHTTEKTIEINAKGFPNIISVLDKEFTIKPGQTKIVRLNLSSFNSKQGIEQAPGVYIGKITAETDSYKKEIPVIVEIESKNVLFDMNLNPVARDRKIIRGESTTFEIRVFNLQDIKSYNVDMDYFVKDINGNTIISEGENVVVRTQASFFKTLKIPQNLRTGNYVFIAQASFGNSVGTASYLFYVESAEKESRLSGFVGFCRNDPLCWSLSIIIILLMFTIGAYLYFFIGAYIYKKVLGGRIPKPRKVEEEVVEKPLVIKEKTSIFKSFREWKNRRRRAKESKIKRKLEIEKQRLKLKEIKEKELEIKGRVKEKRVKEKEERRGLVGKCRRLVDKGYRALDKNKTEKAEKIYENLMYTYVHLPSERKMEIFKEIDSFYKSLVLKKQQLRQKEEREKAFQEQVKGQKELQGKKELEKNKKEEERKIKLREEKKKAHKKKVFDFFHGLGLIKTEAEKREKIKQRKLKELEKKRRQEGRRKEEEVIKEEKEEVVEQVIEKEESEDKEEHYLEKGLKDLGHIFEQSKKKKPGLIKKIISKKPVHRKDIEAKIQIDRKRKGKSRRFVKCHKLLLKAGNVLEKNDKKKAKSLYQKTMKLYTKMEYNEKKEIYDELNELYWELSK